MERSQTKSNEWINEKNKPINLIINFCDGNSLYWKMEMRSSHARMQSGICEEI